MTGRPSSDWRAEFGLEQRKPPNLFTSKAELTPATPQAHLLRRAFDVLKVDGILCVDHSPLAYFKVVRRISGEAISELHRQFWNHGGASLLIVVTDDRVHIISGMTPPESISTAPASTPNEVEPALPRLVEKMKALIVALESGEYFRRYPRSFDPKQRVDRHLLDNLQNTRDQLASATRKPIPTPVLNALLCRLVFTCYLFDREVIGERYLADLSIRAASLRDLLGNPPRVARDSLYRLFDKLKDDFNGDLFSTDLVAEKKLIHDEHMRTLHSFLQGMSVPGGQGVLFRLYDFKFIPIETISAIYERFLNADELQKGAFYTPRFLAEVVLDTALDGSESLLGKRFLDPSCGSGIFLVGLFNRIAEEWRQANPTAHNDRKAKELMRLLRESLFGVDVNLTACRITAFSLYLAYLDQLSPPDIQGLQRRGQALPRLVMAQADTGVDAVDGNIREADFFTPDDRFPSGVDLVIGNPPWGSIAAADTEAGAWCSANKRLLPDKQIAAAFVWKATQHIIEGGRVCFVLPHGVLFNHSTTAIPFQKAWVRAHAIERVLNLADFQRFLFEKAGHPAVVVSYRKSPPIDTAHKIEYWGPKADWMVTKAEVISIAPQDRSSFTVGQLLQDLNGPDAPQIWKQRFWATPRDWRLLDRLALYPRLRDEVRRAKEKDSAKSWVMAVGFQPVGENDDPDKAETISLPSKRFIRATSAKLDLLLLERDCTELAEPKVTVRNGSNKLIDVFRGPHVLMAKGITSTAFAPFSVSFQDAVRGIHGPEKDHDLLVFLAAYLRSPLALYFLFHTSSNWGISRQEAHVEEVLRLPFPLPEQLPDPKRSRQIVKEVARIVAEAAKDADADFVDRDGLVRAASARIEPLVDEYFDVIPMEKDLVDETLGVVIESTRPTRAQKIIPTLVPANRKRQQCYRDRVCEMLNGWSKNGPFAVRGVVIGSELLGVGVVVLEKVSRSQASEPMPGIDRDLLHTLDAVRRLIPQTHATIDLVRGVMVYDGPRLYVVKPISQRYWTLTAAMNDADEIAASILMPSPQGGA